MKQRGEAAALCVAGWVRRGTGRDAPGASGVLSMVFIPADHKAPGKSCRINQTPCLEPLKLHGSPQPTLVAKRISMFFPPRKIPQGPISPKTMI